MIKQEDYRIRVEVKAIFILALFLCGKTFHELSQVQSNDRLSKRPMLVHSTNFPAQMLSQFNRAEIINLVAKY